MSSPAQPAVQPDDRRPLTQDFLDRFFGEGNDVARLPYIQQRYANVSHIDSTVPTLLPRYSKDSDTFSMYVIANSSAHAAQTGELLKAFVGPTYCTGGDELPAELDPSDPVDSAVLDLAPANSTFVIRTTSNKQRRIELCDALDLLQRTASSQPRRMWNVPQPLGRLIAAFDAALAAGGVASSKAALDLIAAQGRITATNLAHLRIKRLDRLGLSRELLSLHGLGDILRQDPPHPVKEAILNAVNSAIISESINRGDILEACDRLQDVSLPLPVHADILSYGDEASAVLLTAAIGRNDAAGLSRMLQALSAEGRTSAVPGPIWEHASSLVASTGSALASTTPAHGQGSPDDAPEAVAHLDQVSSELPTGWGALLQLVAQDDPNATQTIDDESWRGWPSPADADEELAALLTDLSNESWSRVWKIVGPLIDAVGYGDASPRTARELITYALAFDRLSNSDLIAIHALSEIFLRSSPPASAYRDLLDELRESCDRWVSPETATTAMDFADRLVLAACPDEEARLRFAVALLEPLHRHQRRLDTATIAFAQQLSEELGTQFEWEQAEPSSDEESPTAALSGRTILLYSLDEAVLARTSRELERHNPGLKVLTSHDKVGSPTLKKKAQHADFIILATRCAKHAATGFITENAGKARIAYADGSGSASLLRAAVNGLLT